MSSAKTYHREAKSLGWNFYKSVEVKIGGWSANFAYNCACCDKRIELNYTIDSPANVKQRNYNCLNCSKSHQALD